MLSVKEVERKPFHDFSTKKNAHIVKRLNTVQASDDKKKRKCNSAEDVKVSVHSLSFHGQI